jgi:hypothetical protein
MYIPTDIICVYNYIYIQVYIYVCVYMGPIFLSTYLWIEVVVAAGQYTYSDNIVVICKSGKQNTLQDPRKKWQNVVFVQYCQPHKTVTHAGPLDSRGHLLDSHNWSDLQYCIPREMFSC